MKREDRKAAIAEYKERKAPRGIYAVRCAANGGVWVGESPDLDKIENRLRFMLNMNNCRNASLLAAWAEHGADAFAFETLEILDDDLTGIFLKRRLGEQSDHWRKELDAEQI